jgi:23S rRNA (cytidine1920-2'-O)/16S rRNA (cytidine1409-2'-O)-methyltransferase
MARKTRLDLVLVERGYFDSREKAQRAVMAGWVTISGQPASKPGQGVADDVQISVSGGEKYVGRGGLKMEGALDAFGVNPAGRVCLDIGASTGGFTDCLLQRGAVRVHAIDVGHGQIDWKLRNDPRVVVKENLNARHLTFEDVGERVTLIVADVSFISLTLILPPAFALLEPAGEMIVLIKPQFELSASEVGKGGVVRDEALRLRVVETIRQFVEAAGHQWLGFIESPIAGREGNREFLAHLKL